MTPKQYLLSKLAEECNQVAHSCLKAIHYGLDGQRPEGYTTHKDDITNRMNDVRAILGLMKEAGIDLPFDRSAIDRRRARALEKLGAAIDRGAVVIDRNDLPK